MMYDSLFQVFSLSLDLLLSGHDLEYMYMYMYMSMWSVSPLGTY